MSKTNADAVRARCRWNGRKCAHSSQPGLYQNRASARTIGVERAQSLSKDCRTTETTTSVSSRPEEKVEKQTSSRQTALNQACQNHARGKTRASGNRHYASPWFQDCLKNCMQMAQTLVFRTGNGEPPGTHQETHARAQNPIEI